VARQEGRNIMTKEEDDQADACMAIVEQATRDMEGSTHKLLRAQEAKKAEENINKQMEEKRGGAEKPKYDRVARVGSEERTYRPDSDKGGRQFLRDVARQYLFQDPDAVYRLTRHMQEEKVERSGQMEFRTAGDAVTSAFAGLTVPQFLTDMYAPAVAGMRPFADICNKHPLPAAGMTFSISKITTATSAALQSAELAAVSATSIDDTKLDLSLQTAAGQQLMSRQAIERGTGTEDVTMQDLFKRYATVLDSTLLNQASTGLTNVAQAVTYTDTTPTAAELYPKILNALANSEAALLGQAAPSHAVMNPRRWYWLQSQVGSTWPMVTNPGIATQAVAANYGIGYDKGIRGVLPNGTLVVADANVATTLGGGTEDEIYIVAADECHLFEDAGGPVFIRAEQAAAANLGVLLVVYGYFAYTHNRFTNGQSKISGSGLAAPTF
jgi:hypothetical protein